MDKKKILIICPNPEGYAPGQRLKYEQYFEHWQQKGYDIIVNHLSQNHFKKSYIETTM